MLKIKGSYDVNRKGKFPENPINNQWYIDKRNNCFFIYKAESKMWFPLPTSGFSIDEIDNLTVFFEEGYYDNLINKETDSFRISAKLNGFFLEYKLFSPKALNFLLTSFKSMSHTSTQSWGV